MKITPLAALAFCLFLSFSALAQQQTTSSEAVSVPAWQPNPAYNTVLEGISSAIGDSATANITDAEQVFCYQIANKPDNYTGYTLDGMAIVGFCGVIAVDLLRRLRPADGYDP